MGVTELFPDEWEQTNVLRMRHTWSMSTSNGFTVIDAYGCGYCDRWKDKFGDNNLLSDGDTVSVSLCGDRSVSISHNHTEVTQVFTKLPDKKLWLVIEMCVVKLEVAEDLGKIFYYYIASGI